jgi:hypothetical protein
MRSGGPPVAPGSSTVNTRDMKPDFLNAMSCGAQERRHALRT